MLAAAPVLFVLIWSTGFIVARAIVPHAALELVLLARMSLSAVLLGAMAAIARERVPRGSRLALQLLAGALLNGLYLCLSWWAVGRGLPAGIMALLGALQPLVVAAASAGLLGERLSAHAWSGLAIGFAGVILVLAPLLHAQSGGVSLIVTAGAVTSILALSAGTMIQRGAIAGDPVLVSGALQNLGGVMVAVVMAGALGNYRWDGAPTLWLALAWSVLGLSVGGITLLVWMTRHQGATRVSSLLLLVPPLAALEAWLLFGERLLPLQIAGFILALGGVLLARRSIAVRSARPQSEAQRSPD